ncbi:MAG: glutathione S-transferase family protein [Gammaproteobacteria bacterium]|nr:glutathione S-transferase family protein [Gammaproteobacteria bacterium]
MLKVHGVPFSAHTRKVLIAALEKGINYELVPVVPLAPPPGWQELSPLGLIPAIEDDNVRLADSSVILHYLERKYPQPSLYPSDVSAYGRALWIEEFVDSGLASHVLQGLLMQRVFAPKFLNKAPDEAVIKRSLTEMIPPRLAYLEQQLTGDFFAGSFSVADITVASILINFHYAGEVISEQAYPRLYKHLRRVLARPSVQKHLQAEIPAAKSIGALDMRLLS